MDQQIKPTYWLLRTPHPHSPLAAHGTLQKVKQARQANLDLQSKCRRWHEAKTTVLRHSSSSSNGIISDSIAPAHPVIPAEFSVEKFVRVKPTRKKREFTPEMAEKLALARTKASEVKKQMKAARLELEQAKRPKKTAAEKMSELTEELRLIREYNDSRPAPEPTPPPPRVRPRLQFGDDYDDERDERRDRDERRADRDRDERRVDRERDERRVDRERDERRDVLPRRIDRRELERSMFFNVRR